MRTLVVFNPDLINGKKFYSAALSNAEFIDGKNDAKNLIPKIGTDSITLIIPSSLDLESTLSYSGINWALDCYIHILNNDLLNSSIIVVGFEDKGAFYDHCQLSDIIRCPGVHYAQDAKVAVALANNHNVSIDKKKAIEALKKVRVTPPAAFKSHHTIVNEWSIMRWSKYLGFNPKNLTSLDSLYFRYLKCILSIEPTSALKRPSEKISGRILIIDDEIAKGWKDFYAELLSPYQSVSFLTIGDSFKYYSQEQIIKTCCSEVESFNPDIVLVDLRLHESDLGRMSDEKKDRITGIEVIEKIKQVNRGIQVIGITASSKVWNYRKVQYLVDGYIVKESPELSSIDGYTRTSVKNLLDTLLFTSERRYLKDTFTEKNELISKISGLSSDDYIESIKTHLEMSFQLEEIAREPDQYAFAYVNLYQIFEILIKKYYDYIPQSVTDTFMENIKYIYKNILGGDNPLFYDSVKRVYERRNAYIHQNKPQLQRLPGSNIFNKNGYLDAFKYVKEILYKFVDYES